MQRFQFPECVGDTVDRTIAIVRDRIGHDTRVFFQCVWENDRRAHKVEPNVVLLMMDSKWMCVRKTPVFQGHIVPWEETMSVHSDVQEEERD